MSDEIRLRGLRGTGHHGVFADERTNGQEFVVDVDVRLPLGDLADDLAKTVNYGTLAVDIVAAIERDPVDLIETLAERIAELVLAHGAHSVRVEVHKPSAPIPVPFTDVSVVIERSSR